MHDTALVANGAGDHTYLIYVLSRIRYVSICAIFTTSNMIYIVFMILNHIHCILDQFNNTLAINKYQVHFKLPKASDLCD